MLSNTEKLFHAAVLLRTNETRSSFGSDSDCHSLRTLLFVCFVAHLAWAAVSSPSPSLPRGGGSSPQWVSIPQRHMPSLTHRKTLGSPGASLSQVQAVRARVEGGSLTGLAALASNASTAPSRKLHCSGKNSSYEVPRCHRVWRSIFVHTVNSSKHAIRSQM
ncbi:hypothetical protein T01_9791 [Trichinella spiralis]|uniref:Uncharacterized protein n=1 Tax=Trichinella spiralis TaxID=6334 RepID=A0A0V1ASC2_TRISP|nr:hypothetical protein T01_9791 [Trichinella spiralis]